MKKNRVVSVISKAAFDALLADQLHQMDQWRKKSLREEQRFRQGTTSPSFSSTLLDSIYRSIDQGVEEEEEQRGFHRETMKKKQSSTSYNSVRGGGGIERKEMDKWMMTMEKNKEIHRKSLPGFDRKVLINNNDRSSSMFIHSTSSSSDSSSGGGFSSSEAESVYGSRSRSSSVPAQRPPKPIRTSSERNETHHQHQHDYHQRTRSNSVSHEQQQNSKKQHENGFNRTKSKALKIYGDLKKVKQPISPGGRLATFINSLFHTKKQRKTTSVEEKEDLKSKATTTQTTTSTCSSASSFSRSCLSKAPSSNNNGGVKRTVRFYPVSVIVDEDSRPCGEKSVYAEEDKPKPKPKPKPKANLIMSTVDDEREKNQRRIQEAARDLIVSYRKNNDFIMRDSIQSHDNDDEEEDDDAASYASSDLFELDNLASIGIVDHHRYNQELPVYETTHFKMNRAIANGFIL